MPPSPSTAQIRTGQAASWSSVTAPAGWSSDSSARLPGGAYEARWAQPGVTSTGRRLGLGDLYDVGSETIMNLPVPCDVKGEDRQVCADGLTDDREERCEQPGRYVEPHPRTHEGAA